MAPNPIKFTGFGDSYGPRPYKFIGFGDSYDPIDSAEIYRSLDMFGSSSEHAEIGPGSFELVVCRFVGTVPDIVGLVWPSFRRKSGSKSKIVGRILQTCQGPGPPLEQHPGRDLPVEFVRAPGLPWNSTPGPRASPSILQICQGHVDFGNWIPVGFGLPFKDHTFIGFGESYGPKPYNFIWFGESYGPKPYKIHRVW